MPGVDTLTFHFSYVSLPTKCLHPPPPHPHSYVADAWTSRWVNSEHKSDYGQFKLTAGNFYGDAEKDKGKSKAPVMQ